MNAIDAIRQGDRLAISRFLTEVENDTDIGRDLLEALFPFTGRAYLLGITGAPGTGKSSLVNELACHIRKNWGLKIAIVAVDPTSPFSGGALLGDRIRMQDLYGDEGVFIRSMASRGALGGLALRTAAVVSALDAAGFELIIVETVGAGQTEVEISELAHTVVVVESPGLGDDIQAIKAGILEIADIMVVNKSDLPGAENSARALEAMLSINTAASSPQIRFHHGRFLKENENEQQPDTDETADPWIPPVILTAALQKEGISTLAEKIFAHKQYVMEHGLYQAKDKIRLDRELLGLIQKSLYEQWLHLTDKDKAADLLEKVYHRELSPHGFVKTIVKIALNDSEKTLTL